MVPVLRSCQSPIWIWLVNYLHLHLHLQAPNIPSRKMCIAPPFCWHGYQPDFRASLQNLDSLAVWLDVSISVGKLRGDKGHIQITSQCNSREETLGPEGGFGYVAALPTERGAIRALVLPCPDPKSRHAERWHECTKVSLRNNRHRNVTAVCEVDTIARMRNIHQNR